MNSLEQRTVILKDHLITLMARSELWIQEYEFDEFCTTIRGIDCTEPEEKEFIEAYIKLVRIYTD